MNPLMIQIDNRSYPILNLPGRPKALLDRTVARIYGVETRYVNRAVKNNSDKFPPDFYFELTPEEIGMLSEIHEMDLDWKGGFMPKAFTHMGCNMLATVLKSSIAVRRSIKIVRAFTAFESGLFPLLQDLKELYFNHCQIIAAVNNSLEELKSNYHKHLQEINVRLNALEKNRAVEEQIPEKLDITPEISKEQARILHDEAQKRTIARSQIMRLWADFKAEFGIARYRHLPRAKFENALAWIRRWHPE